MKVWLLTNTPSPYQVELLSAIGKSGTRLSVRFMSWTHRGARWNPPANCTFECREMTGFGPHLWSDAFRVHPAALRECSNDDYDCFILSGQYTSLTFAACARRLARRGKPWLMWLEQPWPADYRPAWTRSLSARLAAVRRIRAAALARLLRDTRGVLCIGRSAAEAYARMGADPAKLRNLPYHCDTSRFESVNPSDADRVRERFGLEGKIVFLFSGQLIPRKGVDLLLSAFTSVAKRRDDVAVLIMGDGPERAALESSVPANLQARVRFAGHVPYSDLPAFFGAADAFVLPSRHDGWGVVINEACAAGLPVIAASSVGAAGDLVEDGASGFVFARDDVATLADRMERLAGDPGMRSSFGARAREIVRRFSLDAGAASFNRYVSELAGVKQ